MADLWWETTMIDFAGEAKNRMLSTALPDEQVQLWNERRPLIICASEGLLNCGKDQRALNNLVARTAPQRHR